MVFVKNLQGQTVSFDVSPTAKVAELKARIQEIEAIAAEEQRLVFAGKQLDEELTLADFGIEALSTVHLDLRLLGGGKKRKKKVYTTPKKIKHKRKKVKLSVLKFYKIDDDDNIQRLRSECNSVSCGGGVFMAKHKDRLYCGRCHQTLIEKK
ncbi:unnamed protein product [Bursaphelenchus xylophilus]|uniref:(pine wood nematode) hypothetical protein n=1 Tax=Bursaphelenchus xylophilus TaxID=6326 RepID=A0A1I7RMU6_BURXY|nr:unnamed protein product [Bursaphelenchus xylophilus]CAG9125455.1 unnamed protein product [Bursaphelenchus xylophilus]